MGIRLRLGALLAASDPAAAAAELETLKASEAIEPNVANATAHAVWIVVRTMILVIWTIRIRTHHTTTGRRGGNVCGVDAEAPQAIVELAEPAVEDGTPPIVRGDTVMDMS